MGWVVKQFIPRGLPTVAVGFPSQFCVEGRFDAPGAVAQTGVSDSRHSLWDRIAARHGPVIGHLHVGQHGPSPVQDASPHDVLFVEDPARVVVTGTQGGGAHDGPVATRRSQEGQGQGNEQ